MFPGYLRTNFPSSHAVYGRCFTKIGQRTSARIPHDFHQVQQGCRLGKANPMVQFMPEEAISWVEMKESMRTFDLQKEELPEAITVA